MIVNNSKRLLGRTLMEATIIKPNLPTIAHQLSIIQRIPLLLSQFKQLSNPNYQKFTSYLQSALRKSQLQQSIDRFGCIASNTTISTYQMSVILKGFILYWKGQQMDWEMFKYSMLPLVYEIPHGISTEFVIYLHQQAQSKLNQKQLDSLHEIVTAIVEKLLNSNNRHQRSKAIPLSHYFSIDIPCAKLARIIAEHQNPKDIAFVFNNNGPLLYEFMEECAQRNKLKQAQSILKALKVTNIQQFPSLNQKMESKYLRYQLSANKLYFIQLNIQHSQSLLVNLVYMLMRQNKRKEALHFINKYKLQHIPFKFHLSADQINSTKYFKNILIQNDGWGVTQQIVFQQEQQQQYDYNHNHSNHHHSPWMTLQQLGYQRKSVIWIDSSNIDKVTGRLQKCFPDDKRIGIDSQTVGGIHTFDPIVTTILQVCTPPKIFIFDLLSLSDNAQMKEVLIHMATKCVVVGHGIHNQVASIFHQVKADAKCLPKLRKVDTQQMFKARYPQEKKCSLAFICEYLFKKRLSKYEQCSGWRNRPLRGCQLHYAALDAALPLAIQAKLNEA